MTFLKQPIRCTTEIPDDGRRMQMKGHGEKLSRKQQEAISALLTHPTIQAAAAATGVASVTMWRWLKMPQFQAEYRAARWQVVESAITMLQHATGQAVETLTKNLTCEQPSVEVRAALAIIDQTMKTVDFIEVENRLSAIETRLSEISKETE